MDMAHTMEVQTILDQLKVDETVGLPAAEAKKRIEDFGPNKIEQERTQPWWKILLRQFTSPIVYLLVFAAAVSVYLTEWLDAGAIVIVIFVNAIIGFYMEFQAGRSMEALHKISPVATKVLRDKKLLEINVEEIAPGDIVYLEAGDMVPADGRVIKLTQLTVNESALTGESAPVDKNPKTLSGDVSLAERSNMIFKGTFVTAGNVWAVITDTGMKTELGHIANLVQNAEQAATPLEKKLAQFSKRLIQITVGLVVIIFFAGWMAGQKLLEMISTSIALAVAAIPEGLPIVATLGLARGMLKMARKNVIVKKLSAVETLGGTTVICTDKTGTLTENKMTVTETIPSASTSNDTHQKILEASVLCNTAQLHDDGTEVGDPLETALLRHAGKSFPIEGLRSKFPMVDQEPFSSDSKRMLTTHQHGAGFITYAKGAVEEILKITDKHEAHEKAFSQEAKEQLLSEGEKLASSGYKVIGFGYTLHEQRAFKADHLTFLGMMGLIDPPRPDVAKAIAECKAAGVKVVMITGDHPRTAKEIASQLGLTEANDGLIVGAAMKKHQSLTDRDKDAWINTPVFARVSPAQKLDLITVFQERKFIVGMTGDGVNDGPALKKADIGIAMGQRGTQVAQDVADIVLKDDSFSSIVTAIREGRIIFDNIRKFVVFLLSCNMSELLAIAIVALFVFHFQLLPLQILFINLITDVLPALALGFTPGNAIVMKKPPRKPGEPIVTESQWKSIVFYSAVICTASLGAVLFSHYSFHNTDGWEPEMCNNIIFFTLIGSQLLHVFNMNAPENNFFRSEIVRNKYVWYALAACVVTLAILYQVRPVREVLAIHPLNYIEWLVIIGFSVASLVINQLAKVFGVIKD